MTGLTRFLVVAVNGLAVGACGNGTCPAVECSPPAFHLEIASDSGALSPGAYELDVTADGASATCTVMVDHTAKVIGRLLG